MTLDKALALAAVNAAGYRCALSDTVPVWSAIKDPLGRVWITETTWRKDAQGYASVSEIFVDALHGRRRMDWRALEEGVRSRGEGGRD